MASLIVFPFFFSGFFLPYSVLFFALRQKRILRILFLALKVFKCLRPCRSACVISQIFESEQNNKKANVNFVRTCFVTYVVIVGGACRHTNS